MTDPSVSRDGLLQLLNEVNDGLAARNPMTNATTDYGTGQPQAQRNLVYAASVQLAMTIPSGFAFGGVWRKFWRKGGYSPVEGHPRNSWGILEGRFDEFREKQGKIGQNDVLDTQ